MSVGWQDIAFQIEAPLAEEVKAAWSWLFPEHWTPLICSMVGGIFLLTEDGHVHWLDTGTGLIEQVASSKEQFEDILRSDSLLVEEWFLPSLVESLQDAGKNATVGQCYAFTVLPVFAEGKYEPRNMIVVPIREQFVGVADIHRQLNAIPDGAAVHVKVED
jgi:hypothetical protein